MGEPQNATAGFKIGWMVLGSFRIRIVGHRESLPVPIPWGALKCNPYNSTPPPKYILAPPTGDCAIKSENLSKCAVGGRGLAKCCPVCQ